MSPGSARAAARAASITNQASREWLNTCGRWTRGAPRAGKYRGKIPFVRDIVDAVL
jgi:hypothetical protein